MSKPAACSRKFPHVLISVKLLWLSQIWTYSENSNSGLFLNNILRLGHAARMFTFNYRTSGQHGRHVDMSMRHETNMSCFEQCESIPKWFSGPYKHINGFQGHPKSIPATCQP